MAYVAITVDVWCDIVSDYLSHGDIGNLSQTCKFFHDICESAFIWRRLVMRECGATHAALHGADSRVLRLLPLVEGGEDVEDESRYDWKLQYRLLAWTPTSPAVRINFHTDEVLHVAVSNDGQWLVCCSRDRTASVWSVPDILAGAHDHPIVIPFLDPVGRAIISPDSTHVLLCTCGGRHDEVALVKLGEAGSRRLHSSSPFDVYACWLSNTDYLLSSRYMYRNHRAIVKVERHSIHSDEPVSSRSISLAQYNYIRHIEYSPSDKVAYTMTGAGINFCDRLAVLKSEFFEQDDTPEDVIRYAEPIDEDSAKFDPFGILDKNYRYDGALLWPVISRCGRYLSTTFRRYEHVCEPEQLPANTPTPTPTTTTHDFVERSSNASIGPLDPDTPEVVMLDENGEPFEPFDTNPDSIPNVSHDITLLLLDVESGEVVARYDGPKADTLKDSPFVIESELHSELPFLIACGCEHGNAFVWHTSLAGSPKILKGHTKPVNSVAWVPGHSDKPLLLTGSDDFSVCLWAWEQFGTADTVEIAPARLNRESSSSGSESVGYESSSDLLGSVGGGGGGDESDELSLS